MARDYGLSPLRQIKDIIRLCFVRGAMTPQDYYRLLVFAVPNADPQLQNEFIGDRQIWNLNYSISNRQLMVSLRVVKAKHLHWAVMKAAGIAVPEIQALCHPLLRFGAIPTFEDSEGVKDFLRNEARYPIFGKPIAELGSFGAASIDRFVPESDSLVLLSGDQIPVERFADEIFAAYAQEGYHFQSRIEQHPAIAEICGKSVATVRVVTLRRNVTPEPLYALWKVPRVGSPGDNFWRSGNMIASLDLATGTVLRVQQGAGLEAREVESHPDTGKRLVGWRVPHWDRVLKDAVSAASLTPDLRILSWDVAICADGPVIIEGDETPDHVLYQLATGKGIMSADFEATVKAIRAENKQTIARLRELRKVTSRASRSRKRQEFVDGIDQLGAKRREA